MNLELATADGRCDHATAPADTKRAAGEPDLLVYPPCDDEGVSDEVRHTASNQSGAPQAALIFSPLSGTIPLLVRATEHLCPVHAVPMARPDAAFVRETIVILV